MPELPNLLPKSDFLFRGAQDSRLEDLDLLVAPEQRQPSLDIDDSSYVDLMGNHTFRGRWRRVDLARVLGVHLGHSYGGSESSVGPGDINQAFNAHATAVIDSIYLATRVLIDSNDYASDTDPLDGVVQVEEEVLALEARVSGESVDVADVQVSVGIDGRRKLEAVLGIEGEAIDFVYCLCWFVTLFSFRSCGHG